MTRYLLKRLSALLVLSALIVVSIGLTLQTIAQAAAQPKTLTRNLEPVIVKGDQVASLIGAPVEHLFVYTYNGETWGGQIPVQVDEVTAQGHYTTTEDGQLDANDEIVFMTQDLGHRSPVTIWLTMTLPISDTWYEIEVTDPLSPTRKGWAYLVRSSTLSTSFSTDYANFISATQHVTTNQYGVGFTTTYAGLDYFSLNGSGNILDRTKLRVSISSIFSLTEDDLTNDVENILIKDGPVRVIMEQKVNATPGGFPTITASINLIHLAYASLVQSTASINFTVPGYIDITGVRSSVDFNSAVSGAKFYNARVGDVTIDGSPDEMPATPLSTWGQVSTTTGRLIQVANPASATPTGGIQKNYYCDNNNPASTRECDNSPKTGDDVSYGDSGLLIEGNINPAFTLDSALYVLPPVNGEPDNVGATYAAYFFNPLLVNTDFQGLEPAIGPIFMPIICK